MPHQRLSPTNHLCVADNLCWGIFYSFWVVLQLNYSSNQEKLVTVPKWH